MKTALWTKQQLCTCITLFYTFLCSPCTTRTWNDQILSWLESGNGNAINVTFSLWTRTQSPHFSFNLTSLLSSDWVTWHKAEKVSKDVNPFSATFSLASPLSDRKVPINANYASVFTMELEKLVGNGEITASCQANTSPKHWIKIYKQQKWTLKNLLG